MALKRGYSKLIKFFNILGDFIILNGSFLWAYYRKLMMDPFEGTMSHQYYVLLIWFNLFWVGSTAVTRVYNIYRSSRIEQVLWNTLKTIVLHAGLLAILLFSIKGYYYSRELILHTYLILSLALIIWRLSMWFLLKFYRTTGHNYRRVIVVGGNSMGTQLYNYFKSDLSLGYRFLGFFDEEPDKVLMKGEVRGTLDEVENFVTSNYVDEIYCALPLTETKKIRQLMKIADNNFARFKIIPDFRGFYNKRVNLDFLYDIPMLSIRNEPLEMALNSTVKRVFDVFFSLFVIVVIFPVLFPIIMILIKVSSKGPIFFKQKRSGLNNQEFFCYKFRSMKLNDDADTKMATKGDARITPIGSFMRKTNIDELPQFFNVFLGQMSVVGPRPHMLNHTEEYSRQIDKFMVRHFVKPGITGWAQVNGFRGPIYDPKMIMRRLRYDVWYIENWSFFLDIKIIFLTVFNVFRGEKNAF